MYNIGMILYERIRSMKKHILRVFALTLALLLTLLCAVSCGGKGKTLMTLKKDGVTGWYLGRIQK